ncbi:Dromyosuppressin [Sergentomyia squamirostris]
MHQQLLLLLLITLTAVHTSPVPRICDPAFVEELPAQVKKVCDALEQSIRFSNALNAYLGAETNALLGRELELSPNQIGGKRTDIDHVILRFGRRR